MWGVDRRNQGIVRRIMNQAFPRPPTVLLDDATPGREKSLRFEGNCGIIRADRAEERARGRFVAGYFSYELGLLLEPKLIPLLPARRDVPLLRLGVFERMEQ